jgi:general stress protein YciG
MNFESNTPKTESQRDSEATPKPEATPTKTKTGRPRGFAAMDRKKVSEIASKGGKAAHAAGTAHQFTSDEARVAGKKGGVAPHVRRGRGPRIAPAAPASDVEVTNEGEREEQKSA